MIEYKATGGLKSPYDPRVFKYAPKVDYAASIELWQGGNNWDGKHIDDQHNVGICTSIALTMKAGRYFDKDFSPDFHYLIQKKFFDKDAAIGWGEGSSAYHSILVGYHYGFLPRELFTKWITEKDRKLSYSKYIKKLQAIPDEEIDKLLKIAKQYKVTAFAQTPVNRDALAAATVKCDGLIVRFTIDETWYSSNLKQSDKLTYNGRNQSGHIVNDYKFAGNSRRIVNSWGTNWSGDGTAYYLLNEIRPSEAWSVWFGEFPPEIQQQIEDKNKIIGQLKEVLHTLIMRLRQLLAQK